MMQIDSAILATDKVICKNISRFDDSERGLLSQNILSQLRNFVEYIADKVYANGSDLDPNNYALNVEALKYLQTRGDLRFLHQFHELLQKSVSHYTLDENGSERLMLKYYEYLLKIKMILMGFMFWIILKIFHWIRIQNCQSITRKLQKKFTVQVRDFQQVHIQIDIIFRRLSRSL